MTMSRRALLGGLAAATCAPALGACTGTPHRVAASASRSEMVIGAGAWCWFQAPRAALDGRGSAWLGTTQGRTGPQPGSVDVTQVDLERLDVVARHQVGLDRPDDHTSPSVLPTGSGVQVGWAPHRPADWVALGSIGTALARVRRPDALVGDARGTSYVSAHLVGGERWVLYRGEQFSWNLLTSADGRRWHPRGLVVAPGAPGQRPYLQACAAGDRLHLLATDGNPTEFRGTGIGYATVLADLTVLDGTGRPVSTVGAHAPTPAQLSRVVEGATGRDELADADTWLVDLQVVQGQVTAIVSLRAPRPADGPGRGSWTHRLLHAVLDGHGRWSVEPLGHGGSELYDNQPDYCGLASLDPLDPDAVVVSTDVHPASGEVLRSPADGQVHWELLEGRRAVHGWRWRQLTERSRADNLRPVLLHDDRHRLVAWMRGRYRSWMEFDTHLVVRRL